MFPILFGILTQAHAKDLDENTVGVGVNNWYHEDIPAFSVRTTLPLSQESESHLGQLHLEGLVGFSSDPSTRTQAFLAGRVLTAVIVEDNLNVLAGTGAGFGWVNQTAVLQFQPALEVQYFLFGLEYLSFESGVGMDITLGSGENSIRTSGKLLGGFHYWF
jgi:hypothetical protein